MRMMCPIVWAAVLTACRPDSRSGSAEGASQVVSTAHDAPTPSSSACDLPAGDSEHELAVGDEMRRYLVHVGTALASPPPVLFVWHGFGADPRMALAAMSSAAWNDAIIVAPQGAPRTFEQFGARARPGWQTHEGDLGGRDLALFDALAGELTSRGCLDRRRVYTTGFSNGGFFSNVLACHRGDVLAAAASVGGGGPFSRCAAKVPIMITHGRVDEIVAYEMAQRSFAHWVAHNGCEANARPPTDGCAEAPGCPKDAPVRMCSYEIGHVWPDDQSERATEFLRAFTRP